MPLEIKSILVACFGALTQEFLYLYELRKNSQNRAQKREYKQILRSVDYWLLSLGFILVAGIFSWLWYEGDKDTRQRDYLIMGIAFPLVVKKIITAFAEEKKVKLGKGTFTAKDYFQIS